MKVINSPIKGKGILLYFAAEFHPETDCLGKIVISSQMARFGSQTTIRAVAATSSGGKAAVRFSGGNRNRTEFQDGCIHFTWTDVTRTNSRPSEFYVDRLIE